MMRLTAAMLIGILGVCAGIGEAHARCRDFRKTCAFLNICIRAANGESWQSKINQGLAQKNGHFVWQGLYLCDADRVMEPPEGSFDDISAGCTDPEYLSIAEHRMNCNALPE
jgi:hypothetical protein